MVLSFDRFHVDVDMFFPVSQKKLDEKWEEVRNAGL
jgi:hypothetical protein